MAEKKTKSEAKPEASESPQAQMKNEKKVSRWSAEACKKAARRFDSREAWAKGAPSSYKAAVAHGWDTECCKVLQNPGAKLTKINGKSSAKQPRKALPRSA